jgi:hypothetical protein
VTATNHILAGSVLAAVIKQPVIALPLALASHFVLDAMPHFGLNTWEERIKYIRIFLGTTVLDIILGFSIFIFLFAVHAPWYVIVAGALAYSPDLMWVYRYAIKEKFGSFAHEHKGRLAKFHKGIQKREFSLGLFVEVPLITALFLSLKSLVA